MAMKRLIVSTAVVVGLVGASAASAGEVTRSASALPTIQSAKAPLNARRTVALKKKKNLLQGEEGGAGGGLSTTTLVVGGLAGLAVVGGIIVATESNDSGS
ncbi:MAG: hypothetical protein WC729_26165 [Sphingomonas sp.]|jgi:hypothetical protein|uniref:hypothetical protein n=1 Tax=Sphingomonas sp. TaxID=28214 RepID=UPI003568073C